MLPGHLAGDQLPGILDGNRFLCLSVVGSNKKPPAMGGFLMRLK